MKRDRGDQTGTKKKVRFGETEIIPEDDASMSDADPDLHTKQHDTRGNEETEWLEDVRGGEEQLLHSEETEDGAVPLEPFNLDEERQFGRFEEDGFYVEDRKEKSEANDAWLQSSEATVCSIDVLRRHAEQQEAIAASEKIAKPSMVQILELKKKIVAFLKPRETVLAGLRRLGKKKTPEDQQKPDMKAFGELTELADALLNSGEMDAYSLYREEFENALETMGYGKKEAVDQNPDSKDMFAEDSDREDEVEKKKTLPEASIVEGTEVPSGNQEAMTTQDEVDFASWPISELKRFLTERKVDCRQVVEKNELLQKAKEVTRRDHRPADYQAPEGFVFHAESGYFYSAARGLYYDGSTRCFYDPRTVKWYDEHWNALEQP